MSRRFVSTRPAPRGGRRPLLHVEALESRCLLAAGVASFGYVTAHGGEAAPYGSQGPVGLTPSQISHAYGFDAIRFGSIVGDGTGQTIAIVDAYDNPKFVSSTSPSFAASDLHLFDAAFGLADPPSFTKVNQSGGTSYPAGNTGWGGEIALDVEWAHALAPQANILLVEANSASYADLFAAVNYAKSVPGVSVVSMSFGGGEFSGETSYDTSTFTSPTGRGVTFVASTGDSGAPGGYPSFSPRVLAVGGTRLTQNSAGYVGETGWSSGGGGISTVEGKPSYQSAVTQSSTRRTIPDVSFDADPNSGVAVYNSYANGSSAPWEQIGGTSFSAPAWGALLAIANQGRALAGQGSLDGYSQTLPKLYALPASDFHDVTTGNNGYAAGVGYDLVTGRGSPYANLVANDLIDGTPPPPTDTAGPRVTGSIPTASSTRLTFSEAVDPASFTAADVTITGPNGAVAVTGVTAVAGSATQFDVTYATQTAAGTYAVAVGPDVLDAAGNAMDQNQNGTNGEAADAYTTSFTVTASNTFTFSSSAALRIRDRSETDSPVVVPEGYLISSLQVKVNITHTYDSDLRIYLVAPSGSYILLSNHRGGSGDNFSNTVFADAAATPIASGSAPFSGTYRPEQALSAYGGKNAKGTWTLAVLDDYFGDTGTLNSWSLTINGTPGGGGAPAIVRAGSTAHAPTLGRPTGASLAATLAGLWQTGRGAVAGLVASTPPSHTVGGALAAGHGLVPLPPAAAFKAAALHAPATSHAVDRLFEVLARDLTALTAE